MEAETEGRTDVLKRLTDERLTLRNENLHSELRSAQ